MIERANGGTTVPQIFIGATHVGGCDDLYALEGAGKLDPLLERTGRCGMTGIRPSASASMQMRAGRSPQANLDAVAKLIGEAKAAGADYVQTPEMTNIMEVSRDKLFAAIVAGGERREPRDLPRAGAQAFDPSAHRLAGGQGDRRQGGQPRVPDRSARRDRRALRQDPHVRRRSRQRRELSRVAQLPARRARRACTTCRGAGSASPSATICASRRSTGRWRRPARRSSPFPPPSPSRPARRTGMC